MSPDALKRVRLRLLPWRPRWRTKDAEPPDPGGLLNIGDDAIGMVIGLVLCLVFAPFVVLFLLGVVLLSMEILLVLALLPLLMLVQVVGLRPWVLTLTDLAGHKSSVEVRGTREMWRTRARYRALCS